LCLPLVRGLPANESSFFIVLLYITFFLLQSVFCLNKPISPPLFRSNESAVQQNINHDSVRIQDKQGDSNSDSPPNPLQDNQEGGGNFIIGISLVVIFSFIVIGFLVSNTNKKEGREKDDTLRLSPPSLIAIKSKSMLTSSRPSRGRGSQSTTASFTNSM